MKCDYLPGKTSTYQRQHEREILQEVFGYSPLGFGFGSFIMISSWDSCNVFVSTSTYIYICIHIIYSSMNYTMLINIFMYKRYQKVSRDCLHQTKQF